MSITMAGKSGKNGNLSVQEPQTEKFLEEMTICPICERQLDDPRILPCLHSFCNRCLARKMKENKGVVNCVICSETGEPSSVCNPSDLHQNTFVAFVRKVMASEGALTSDDITVQLKEYSCTSCPKGKQAVQRCEECRDFLCKTCVKVHKSLKILREHTLVDLVEWLSARVSVSGTTEDTTMESHCSIHCDELLDKFCETCLKLVCDDCIELGHAGAQHKICKVPEAASRTRQQIEKLLADTRQTAAKFRGAWEILEKTSKGLQGEAERLREEVKIAISNEKDKMNEREKEYLDKIEDCSQQNSKEIEKYVDKIEIKLDHLSNAFEFTESLLDLGDDMQILNLSSTLQNRLNLLKKAQPILPRQLDDLSYIDLGEETEADLPDTQEEDSKVNDLIETSWKLESSIGSRGSGNGQFDWCRGLCSSLDGHVVVADWGNDRAQVFDKEGEFVCFLNSDKSEAGKLSMPQDVACLRDGRFVAVDKSKYVRVYDPDGKLYLSFQTANDSEVRDTGAELACVTVDRRNRILVGDCKRNMITFHYADGKHIKSVQAIGPAHLATDSTDRILVSCPKKQKVRVMTQEGRLLFHIDTFGEEREKLKPQGLTCDDADNIYIVHKERGGEKSVHMYNSQGDYITCISEGGFREPYDVTVSPTGRVIISDEDTIKVFWKK